ncbi:heat shock protein Hsp20 [Neoasaia chiangmaiensis NBRC 101099]|uniref:Heat-shock protein n=1 Tax=Neoasaia chiangmaiensis TaxID=320497 RepID=A0A1U9KMD0_9PROT|nr:Hsp20 family protein [Neoasaia chiangmaiensis]AQS86942.1 heat-shock protein [Neoasaia chiangmaiensis]GBR37644.1 heat shock protein Hsp20 [Neoasaia chiangmaiensis NBRC 101099]GEN15049.1 heat-shock protein IbpA [Neoasaia chiangmaiensis]
MTYDFAPLFRTAIGFDRLARLVDTAANAPTVNGYPPYNIEKIGDSDYVLTMALAGFSPENVDVSLVDNTLIVKGAVPEATRRGEILHRGIASRAFERRFVLADHIEIRGAELSNGLLTIAIERVTPEALKPRRIPVTTGKPASVSDHERQPVPAQAA